MRMPITTTIRDNAAEPQIVAHWHEAEGAYGYEATLTLFGRHALDALADSRCEHHILIAQGVPLGKRFIHLDGFTHGCWASMELPGFGITEQDLQWATAWALQAIKHKHFALGESCGCAVKQEQEESK